MARISDRRENGRQSFAPKLTLTRSRSEERERFCWHMEETSECSSAIDLMRFWRRSAGTEIAVGPEIDRSMRDERGESGHCGFCGGVPVADVEGGLEYYGGGYGCGYRDGALSGVQLEANPTRYLHPTYMSILPVFDDNDSDDDDNNHHNSNQRRILSKLFGLVLFPSQPPPGRYRLP
jgi:hypothetical protein